MRRLTPKRHFCAATLLVETVPPTLHLTISSTTPPRRQHSVKDARLDVGETKSWWKMPFVGRAWENDCWQL